MFNQKCYHILYIVSKVEAFLWHCEKGEITAL